MRLFTCISCLALCLPSQILWADALSEKIDALIKKKLPHATVGMVLKDAQTGATLYSRNADKLLSPASSTKLFTAAAALYQLDPKFRFFTTLSQKGNNLYLTFTGSPSFTDKNLNDLLLTLKTHKIQSIDGNIVLDTQRFKPPYYPGGTSYDDLGWYYAAPTTTLILNENAVAYDFISAKELRKPIQIKPRSPSKALTIINDVITVSREEAKNHCDLNILFQSNNTVHLYGCLAQTKAPRYMNLAIPDPDLYAKQIITETLKENGITLKGQIVSGRTPTDAKPLAKYQSKELYDLVAHMLHESDNLYANILTQQLGYSVMDRGDQKQGVYAMKKILSEHTDLNLKQMKLADGLGTRYNLISADQLVSLLTNLYNNPSLQPTILKALPKAGVSGSLRDRMKKTSLEQRVIAKTGSMHDISSLSGYLINTKNKTYIFSIIINNVHKPLFIAKKLEEQILQDVDEILSQSEGSLKQLRQGTYSNEQTNTSS